MTCARARVCVACSGISGPDTRDGYSATRRAMLEDTRPFPFLRGPRPRRPLSLRPLDTFADCSPGWTSTRRTCSGRAWRSAAAGLRTSQTALGRAASCRQTRACGGARTGIAATREGHRGLLRLRRTPGGRRGWLSGGAVTGHPPPPNGTTPTSTAEVRPSTVVLMRVACSGPAGPAAIIIGLVRRTWSSPWRRGSPASPRAEPGPSCPRPGTPAVPWPNYDADGTEPSLGDFNALPRGM